MTLQDERDYAVSRNMKEIDKLKREIARLKVQEVRSESITFCQPILSSTNFDGNSFSDTGDWVKIDVSAEFGLENARAVFIRATVRDSASGTTNGLWVRFGDGVSTQLFVRATGFPNDQLADGACWIPCDENGDFYYWVNASGTNTTDIWLYIISYM